MYKKDYRVFYFGFGWGYVTAIGTGTYPVLVTFDSGEECSFTADGKIDETHRSPSLSFTEYGLQYGGFSQVPPNPYIKLYTPIFVKHTNCSWVLRRFREFNKEGKVVTYSDQNADTNTRVVWDEYSIEMPLNDLK